MNEPTPEKQQDVLSNWPGFIFLSVVAVSAAAVCIVGMVKFL